MRSRAAEKAAVRVVHPYAWLWEPLAGEPSFVLRPMFGTKAVYLDGRLMLCFSPRREPWRGVLVATSPEHHASLLAEFSALRPHPVLAKWLYLPESADAFERTGQALVQAVRRRDPRVGVAPLVRKTRRPRTTAAGQLARSPTQPVPKAALLALASKVFGGTAAARRWWRKPQAEFAWATPADHARTPAGAKAVEVLLINLHLRTFV